MCYAISCPTSNKDFTTTTATATATTTATTTTATATATTTTTTTNNNNRNTGLMSSGAQSHLMGRGILFSLGWQSF